MDTQDTVITTPESAEDIEKETPETRSPEGEAAAPTSGKDDPEGNTPEADGKVTLSKQEIEKRVYADVQKRTSRLQEELNTLRKEKADLERQSKVKKEDTALSRYQAKETEEWGDTPEVKEFQEAERELTKKVRDLDARELVVVEKEETQLQTGIKQTAFEEMLKVFVPEDRAGEFTEAVDSLFEKLKDCKTEKEITLTLKTEMEEVKSRIDKPKRKKPASNTPSASGVSDDEIRKRYRENPDDPKNRSDYLELRTRKSY